LYDSSVVTAMRSLCGPAKGICRDYKQRCGY